MHMTRVYTRLWRFFLSIVWSQYEKHGNFFSLGNCNLLVQVVHHPLPMDHLVTTCVENHVERVWHIVYKNFSIIVNGDSVKKMPCWNFRRFSWRGSKLLDQFAHRPLPTDHPPPCGHLGQKQVKGV